MSGSVGIDTSFSIPRGKDIDYAALKQHFRRNGLVVLRDGNADKFTMAKDGERQRLHIYGRLIHDEKKDRGVSSGDHLIDSITDRLRWMAQEGENFPGEGEE